MLQKQVAKIISTTISSRCLVEVRLPSGWVGGRRGEAWMNLKRVKVRGDQLVMQFGLPFNLVVVGVTDYAATPKCIVLREYSRVVGEWPGIGKREVFEKGKVVIAVVRRSPLPELPFTLGGRA
jgi:hypothetical protein